MRTTNGKLEDKFLNDRYKVIEELNHIFQLYKPRLFKCLDKWSGKIVLLKLMPSTLKTDSYHAVQICKGLLIASELQQQSDKFLKINDISYCSVIDLNGTGFVVNTEYMDWTLAEAIEARKISYEDKIRIFYKIVQAVNEMAEAGIVHTNLNPNHILLSKDLQTVKICGLIHNAMHITDYYEPNLVLRHTYPHVKHNEIMFRSIEFLVESIYGYQPPSVSSAMDVWSLGAIFAYMLKDGIPLFGAQQGGHNYVSVFATLGQPRPEDMDSLKVQHRHYFTGKMPKAFTSADLPQKWIPLLQQIFQYQPEKRITIKQLVNHALFKYHFEELESRGVNHQVTFGTSTKKMDPISTQFPSDLWRWKPKEIRALFKSLLGTRRSLINEKRKDLIVLACNLGNATSVPAEIWVTIFMYANTTPVMYSLPAKTKFIL